MSMSPGGINLPDRVVVGRGGVYTKVGLSLPLAGAFTTINANLVADREPGAAVEKGTNVLDKQRLIKH
jgi:hypothetical protein